MEARSRDLGRATGLSTLPIIADKHRDAKTIKRATAYQIRLSVLQEKGGGASVTEDFK